LRASIDKAKTLMDYEPRTDFEAGLRQCIRWFEKNWSLVDRDAEFPPGMSSAVPSSSKHVEKV